MTEIPNGPSTEEIPEDLTERIRGALDEFTKRRGRLGGHWDIVRKWRLEDNKEETARIIIDHVHNNLETMSLLELSQALEFLSDYSDENRDLGGGVDSLRMSRDPKLVDIRKRIIKRLLSEEPKSHSFLRLWERAVPFQSIVKMKREIEKENWGTFMLDELRKIDT